MLGSGSIASSRPAQDLLYAFAFHPTSGPPASPRPGSWTSSARSRTAA